MTKVTVCIGSSCHLKGSRQVVEQMQYLIKREGLGERIELSGAFCMGKCSSEGVSVTVDDAYYAVDPGKV
ncbi:MAG: (2Fe-2S) ferredoxin domain-containing protein, partial [Treponema sp.]|nr:(2Fe-2S) ferredoxin domain-containing protein [Treponema sp.]